MIVPRACDLCLRALPTELVQFERVRGALANSSLQWTIEPVRAGTRLTTICRPCADYLQGGLAHLRAQLTLTDEDADAADVQAS